MKFLKSKKIRLHRDLFVSFILIGATACDNTPINPSPGPAPEEYRYYRDISSSEAKSESHKIVKIIDYPNIGIPEVHSIAYDQEHKMFMVYWSVIGGDDYGEWRYKIDNNGKVLDTLSNTDISQSGKSNTIVEHTENGILFSEDVYFDWYFSGNKAPTKYLNKIDMDVLSLDEYQKLYEKASTVLYGDYPYNFLVYMKIDHGWIRLESKIIYKNMQIKYPRLREKSNFADLFHQVVNKYKSGRSRSPTFDSKRFTKKGKNESIDFRNSIEGFDVAESVVTHKYQTNLIYSKGSSAFSAMGNTTGLTISPHWSGINYYNLEVNDDVIGFKLYFSEGFNLMEFYDQNSKKRLFIEIKSRNRGYGESEQRGLYLVTDLK